MSEPTPDLFDICVVLNEATDAPLGTSLTPYAERIKTIVIEALAQEAESSGHWASTLKYGPRAEPLWVWLRFHTRGDA